jgi:hypothetical protein
MADYFCFLLLFDDKNLLVAVRKRDHYETLAGLPQERFESSKTIDNLACNNSVAEMLGD